MARPSITIGGQRFVLDKKFPPTKIERNQQDQKKYQVYLDTKKYIGEGTIITGDEYKALANSYDIRIIEWPPGHFPEHSGQVEFYISGSRKGLIRERLEMNAVKLTPMKDYLLVVGEKHRPIIYALARDVGKSLFLQAIPDPPLGNKRTGYLIDAANIGYNNRQH